jgi:hypothetical protein
VINCPHTWQANANFELQLRSDSTKDEIFLRILRWRQFCWPPKLSGCPFCHLKRLLTKSALPFEVHHLNWLGLAFSRLTPPVQKFWIDFHLEPYNNYVSVQSHKCQAYCFHTTWKNIKCGQCIYMVKAWWFTAQLDWGFVKLWQQNVELVS